MDDNQPPAKCVFINPNFKAAHINPKFLKSMVADSIHVNPNFLAQLQTSQPTKQDSGEGSCQGRIIAKSKNKLIREPMNVSAKVRSIGVPSRELHATMERRLIKIGTRKLIRAPLKDNQDNVRSALSIGKISPLAKKKRYKIDRRAPKLKGKILAGKTFTGRYALSRVAECELLVPRRIITRGRRVCRLERTLTKDKSLLNINGVLYKSSKNKLEKTAAANPRVPQPMQSIKSSKLGVRKRVVIVRGNKFLLDNGGRSLKKIDSKDNVGPTLKRIDIGGLTYVANSQNVLIRTDGHKTRNYLSSAKSKSINVLSKCLVKSNVPCPIFRKVGKCGAFERGKCAKVHDKKHVAICRKFLKGECLNEKCLLSHEVSLSKMPTCKFFLLGCCTRPNCPYLHKKLNEKTEICTEFLKGFCQLAEKCAKRHEFLCPDFESKGNCEKPRCPYLHRKAKSEPNNRNNQSSLGKACQLENKIDSPRLPRILNEEQIGTSTARYYFNDKNEKIEKLNTSKSYGLDEKAACEDDTNKPTIRGRKKLGDLPAFIPL